MNSAEIFQELLDYAEEFAQEKRHEFLLPEHILYSFVMQSYFRKSLEDFGGMPDEWEAELNEYFDKIETVPSFIGDYTVQKSVQTECLLDNVNGYEDLPLCITTLLLCIYQLEDSFAASMLRRFENFTDFYSYFYYEIYEINPEDKYVDIVKEIVGKSTSYSSSSDFKTLDFDNDSEIPYTTSLSDNVKNQNKLIGRVSELERIIQILCRKNKNNPILIGEAGVGKTAIIYGLAKKIIDGNVPSKLKDCCIYQLHVADIISGAQYRGELEQRITGVLKKFRNKGNAIVCIDDIHTIIDSGHGAEASTDIVTLLKPFMEDNSIRFIGTTTYNDYNKTFLNNKSIANRFQQVDIFEPTIDETIQILEGLIPNYEEFHNVKYESDVLEYAVNCCVKFIHDRFLPDKAFDVIDEAGAYKQIHPAENGVNVVDEQLIDEVICKICKIKAEALKEKDNDAVLTLEGKIKAQIFGQDEAIQQVVETVQLSKAGLLDDNKPMASFMFVGPTGVGKTELCKILASELGVELIRFDMSEYAEKHTIAKLIGSPAGYVGYDDGGLLTDAIRRSPNCVLLFDEIEKAHQDIYNILLQVMDYAKLTDNKGNKSDFRNVILIMTSNCGAQFAHQGSLGFGSKETKGTTMLSQVKKTFKPEFLNRLNAMVVFNEMSTEMAELIFDKKISLLKGKLKNKNVNLFVDEKAKKFLVGNGYSNEYGAREMDRIIRKELTTTLMKEILFGKLKQGGDIYVTLEDNNKLYFQVKN